MLPCTNTKAKYSNSVVIVVPPDPSVHFYHCWKVTHTHTHNRFTALWILSGTTRLSRYQKKHLSTHTYRGHQSYLICFIHLIRSTAFSLFNLCTWSFSTISLQVLFRLPLGLAHSTSYSTHFFTQSLSSFRNKCRYHRNMFCFSANITNMSSNPSLSLSTLYLEFYSNLTPNPASQLSSLGVDRTVSMTWVVCPFPHTAITTNDWALIMTCIPLRQLSQSSVFHFQPAMSAQNSNINFFKPVVSYDNDFITTLAAKSRTDEYEKAHTIHVKSINITITK